MIKIRHRFLQIHKNLKTDRMSRKPLSPKRAEKCGITSFTAALACTTCGGFDFSKFDPGFTGGKNIYSALKERIGIPGAFLQLNRNTKAVERFEISYALT